MIDTEVNYRGIGIMTVCNRVDAHRLVQSINMVFKAARMFDGTSVTYNISHPMAHFDGGPVYVQNG